MSSSTSTRLGQKNHGVPGDLIVDILVKLPVKSLVRFKYLSKQWFRLITNPRFIDLHLSNQRKKGPGFVTAFRNDYPGDLIVDINGFQTK
ncbi:hypothetical protein V6N13_014606 [Hibiscus sabdariffa]|uniref:F-box domain-containing protein n=1 Tax=Hibiscus sabdariffa TaxID=183260 RepID=A0ABR2RWI1_9ROSI